MGCMDATSYTCDLTVTFTPHLALIFFIQYGKIWNNIYWSIVWISTECNVNG